MIFDPFEAFNDVYNVENWLLPETDCENWTWGDEIFVE